MRMQAESVLPEPSKIHYFFGKFRFVFPKKIKKKDYFLEKKILLLVNAARSVTDGRVIPCDLLPLLA